MTYPGHLWVDDDTTVPVSAATLSEMDTALIAAHARVAVVAQIPYAATITPNAATGSIFYCIATGDLTLTDPTGGTNGKTVTVAVQASGGPRTVTFADGTAVTIPTGEWSAIHQVYLQTPNVWLTTDGV